MKKIPVTIITGFLGAGKTTLIRHVLEHSQGRRLALVINEFGDVGVDADILRGCGVESCPDENIIELANGCICCTVADDFIPAIEALLARKPQPEHIIIETSGLALPKPLVKAFDWPEIRAKLTVDGVIAVVDGAAVSDGRFVDDPIKVAAQRAADPNLDHENPLEEVYEDQLLCADMVVVNKVDLLNEAALKRICSDITAQIPRAVKIVTTRDGKIDVNVLLGLSAKAEDDLTNRYSHHDAEEGHDHDDFDTFVLELGPVDDGAKLVELLAEVAAKHDVLRMKGFISVANKPMRLLVQGVGSRFQQQYDRPWHAQEERSSRIVIIGEKGMNKSAITADLRG